MMPSFVRHALVVGTAVHLVACGQTTSPEVVDSATSSATIDALPRALTTGEQKIVGAANGFSLALFKQLSGARADSNVFASPLSASMALGMTMNGAAGATHEQMRTTLGFGASPDTEINAGYQGLISLLRGLDPRVDVRVANSIWYRNGFPINASFLDQSRISFDARVTGLDFDNPASVNTINDWVSTATSGRIVKIVERIPADQVMYLINAIYFKGSWRERFDPAKTTDATFRGVAGDQPMRLMRRFGAVRSASTSDFTAVDLAYGNSAYSMTVILPHAGRTVDNVVSALQGSGWNDLVGRLRESQLDIAIPRFKMEWERVLNADLQAMGMRDAFTAGAADFTRLSPRGRELVISQVKQKSYVDVNEEGTEAAAVTSVGVSVTSAPVPFRADRPFVFAIRERLSGTILFMGKIVRMP